MSFEENLHFLLLFLVLTFAGYGTSLSVSLLPEAYVLYEFGYQNATAHGLNNQTAEIAGVELVQDWLLLQQFLNVTPQEAFLLITHPKLKNFRELEAILAPVLRKLESVHAANLNSSSKMVNLSKFSVLPMLFLFKFINS